MHPVSKLFRNELGRFIDEHFELELNEMNQARENTDDHTSFAHSFFHGITSLYPDERRLTPKTRSLYIYYGYRRNSLFLYQQNTGYNLLITLFLKKWGQFKLHAALHMKM